MSRLTLGVGLAGGLVAGASLVEATDTIDEFLPLVCAQRLLAGEVPYRDFVSLYGPLWPAADAVAFVVFAPTVIAARVLFLGVLVAAFVVVARLAARLSGSERHGAGIALLAALAVGRPAWGYALVP